MFQYFSFACSGNIAILISTLLLQCQQLPWKMEPNITLALICNPVLPEQPICLCIWPYPPPSFQGKTKHPAHWFCSTFGSLFFLNSYTFWFLRHQFSSLPNTSRPSAAFTFFWWWLIQVALQSPYPPVWWDKFKLNLYHSVERILCCG